MSIREFRRLPIQQRRRLIQSVADPVAQAVLRSAFWGWRKNSWCAVAMTIGNGNTADGVRMIATRAVAVIPLPMECEEAEGAGNERISL